LLHASIMHIPPAVTALSLSLSLSDHSQPSYIV
jgi:hypothetical protein